MRCIGTCLLLLLFATEASAQGPVLLVGIDTEYGSRPANSTHGTIATWATVLQNGLLGKVSNGKSGILVIGGGKAPTDEVTNFWTQIGTALSASVTFANTFQIGTVSFSNVALIAVANSVYASGRLTQVELDILNARAADVAAFICAGGGLFASVELLSGAYKFLPGDPVTMSPEQYSAITPTPAGVALGITNTNLNNGPWHGVFTSFPSYLQVLATNVVPGNIAAIGGGAIQPAKPSFTLAATQCLSGPIMADGSGSVFVKDHFWSVQESDASWNRFGTEAMSWFTGKAGPIDLKAFAAPRGVSFKCNTYYRVKLAVTGLCSGWAETSRLLFVRCPPVAAGPDVCCDPLTGTALGAPPNPQVQQYLWSPAKGLSDATVSNPFFLPYAGASYPLTYTVTAKDALGCTATDTVRVFCGPPTISIDCGGDTCRPTLTAQAGQAASLSWSTGATGSQISVSSNGTYNVTASNPCKVSTAGIAVGSVETGDFPPLIFPNSFAPNGGSNKVFQIFHFGLAAGTRPAYNSTGYSLSVLDRWGGWHVVAHDEVAACQSLYNGQIQWDGKINGNVVQEGAYTWQLQLKNCSHNWTSSLTEHTQKLVCTRYEWPWWCAWSCRQCVAWAWQDVEDTFNSGTVNVLP